MISKGSFACHKAKGKVKVYVYKISICFFVFFCMCVSVCKSNTNILDGHNHTQYISLSWFTEDLNLSISVFLSMVLKYSFTHKVLNLSSSLNGYISIY